MEGVVVVYYDDDMVSTCDGVLFEYPKNAKYIKISEEMSLISLRKAVIDVIEGGRSLFEVFFYHKHVYVSNGYVEYDCMKLKDDNNVEKMFSFFWSSVLKDQYTCMQWLTDLQKKSL